jgi:hypothetical protein
MPDWVVGGYGAALYPSGVGCFGTTVRPVEVEYPGLCCALMGSRCLRLCWALMGSGAPRLRYALMWSEGLVVRLVGVGGWSSGAPLWGWRCLGQRYAMAGVGGVLRQRCAMSG